MALQPALFPEIEEPDFVRSSEVAGVAEDVLRIHGKVGGVGRLHPVARAIADEEIHVLWLLNAKPFDPEKDEEGHDAAGKCVKAPALWHDVTRFDVVIWIREFFWSRWDEATRRAAVLHELLHVEVDRDRNNQAKVRIRKHDVEDFVDVVRHYGPIFGEGPALVRAAAAFRGHPEPLRPDREAIDVEDLSREALELTVAAANAGAFGEGVSASVGHGPSPAVGDPVVVDGAKLRIKSLDETYAYARASFGNRSLVSVELGSLAWDDESGVWREGGGKEDGGDSGPDEPV